MATPTYTLIDSTVLGSSASSVTFSSISQDYRDLVLVVELVSTNTSFAALRFNSDSGSNYSNVWMQGDGSTASSSSQTTTYIRGFSSAARTNPIMATFQIMDYSATDKHKSTLTRSLDPGLSTPVDKTVAYAGRWASTSAITQIDVVAISNSYDVGSTFYLYGIEA